MCLFALHIITLVFGFYYDTHWCFPRILDAMQFIANDRLPSLGRPRMDAKEIKMTKLVLKWN
jgi:hypothetical protein